MHKDKPIIYIAAHGAISGKQQLIDVSNYCVIFPTKVGDRLGVTTHNLLVRQLTNYAQPETVLEDLEALPTTVSVSKTHKPTQKLTIDDDLSDIQARKKARLEIDDIEKKALDSQKSWELFEHKLAPIYDLIASGLLLPLPSNYSELPISTKTFISDPTTTTLKVYFDTEKIIEQLQDMVQQAPNMVAQANAENIWLIKGSISKDHVLYILPCVDMKKSQALSPTERLEEGCINLSNVLNNYLPKMHLLIRDLIPPLTPEIQVVVDILDEEVINLDPVYSTFRELQPFEVVAAGDKIWCDITIPEDANIILGACRDIHPDF